MEGLKRFVSDFRYKGMLAIALVFLLVAFILFIERSGISYNYTHNDLCELPKEKIVTKVKANENTEKNTLVLWQSSAMESALAMEEFSVILSDMKVGYVPVDLFKEPFPDLSEYKIAVILISDLSPMGENVFTLCDWVREGGYAQFALTLQKSVYTSVIETNLGISEASWGNAKVDSIYVDEGFMAGGGRSFAIDDGYDSAWAVQLDYDKTKLYAYTDDYKKTPLIWETTYGKGKFVVDNFGLYERVMRGFFAASYSLLDEVCAYPVINASTFYLDDFPSQIPAGDSKYITRDYNTSIRDFYVNIWWPDMMNFADIYGLKYTGLAIACYDDKVDGTTPTEPDKGTFLNFGNMLLRQGGEIGYHGYNHQPLCLSDCDYNGLFDYKTWESTEAMKGAFDELVDFCDELFPDVKMSLYVPPSNILSKEGEEFLFSAYPHIKTISGIYFPDGDFSYNCTQEYEVLPDGRVHQPRIVSGCDLSDFMEIAVISELNFHYINNHFTHPDDALDPERGAQMGWEKLKGRFNEYLSWLYSSAPGIRSLTGSETSAAVQRYAAVNIKKEIKDNVMTFNIGNFYDEAHFMVRFNSRKPGKVNGGELTHITGNLYLLTAQKNTVTVNLK